MYDEYLRTVTGVEEITPEQSSLSLTTSLKLFITQMHDYGFGLIGPRQVHAEYKMHTCRTLVLLLKGHFTNLLNYRQLKASFRLSNL